MDADKSGGTRGTRGTYFLPENETLITNREKTTTVGSYPQGEPPETGKAVPQVPQVPPDPSTALSASERAAATINDDLEVF